MHNGHNLIKADESLSLHTLPKDVLFNLFNKLSLKDLMKTRLTCKRFSFFYKDIVHNKIKKCESLEKTFLKIHKNSNPESSQLLSYMNGNFSYTIESISDIETTKKQARELISIYEEFYRAGYMLAGIKLTMIYVKGINIKTIDSSSITVEDDYMKACAMLKDLSGLTKFSAVLTKLKDYIYEMEDNAWCNIRNPDFSM